MKLHAKEAAGHVALGAELMHEGRLVAVLTGREALSLCDRGYVEGIAWLTRDDQGERVVVLRYLSLIVTMAKLRSVLRRVAVKQMQSKAEDSRTFQHTRFGYAHHVRRCLAYEGGPARLLEVRLG